MFVMRVDVAPSVGSADCGTAESWQMLVPVGVDTTAVKIGTGTTSFGIPEKFSVNYWKCCRACY